MVSPYLRVRCPMPPPSVRPPTPVLPTMPGGDGQAERVGGMIDIAPAAAAADAHRPRGRVHVDVADGREIDDQAIVADAEPAGIVAAAADRNAQLILAAETYRGHDVRHIGALGDQPRLAADHRIVNLPRVLITRVFRLNQFSAKLAAELRHCLLCQHIPSLSGRSAALCHGRVRGGRCSSGGAGNRRFRPRARNVAQSRPSESLRQPALAAHSSCSIVRVQPK